MKSIMHNTKLFLKENSSALLILVLISMGTLILLSQKEIMATVLKVAKDGYRGVGSSIPQAVQISNWRNYYGGSMGIDRVISGSGNAVRISTGTDGNWYGARGDIKAMDLTDKSLRFLVRFDDFDSVRTFLVLIATDNGRFDNYFAFNVVGFFARPANGEWHEIIVDKSDFQVAQGNPDWSNVTDIGLRVTANAGNYTRVWFDGFSVTDNTFAPIVSLTFDDGFRSNIQAADIMKEYGFAGTAYVIPSYLNTNRYLTQQEVDYLHNLGWDISGHGHTNLRLYSFADAEGDLALMKQYLNLHDYKGKNHYSYPNGGYTESLRSLVAEYFETGRTIDGLSQPQNYLIPTKINAKTISNIHSVENIKNWIDDAVREKSWLILTWHDLVAIPLSDTEYSIETFREIVRYLDEIGVEVLPFSEAYSRLNY